MMKSFNNGKQACDVLTWVSLDLFHVCTEQVQMCVSVCVYVCVHARSYACVRMLFFIIISALLWESQVQLNHLISQVSL